MSMETRQENFQKNFDWQENYIDAVRNIVGPRLIVPAPLEKDMKEATDFMVLTARDLRIGCRIRRYGYLDYVNEFTIRAWVPYGVKTEIHKIDEGWGDWLFYAHAAHDELPSLSHWMIVDLEVFRACIKKIKKELVQAIVAIKDFGVSQDHDGWGTRPNFDGSWLLFFNFMNRRLFPENILIDTNIEQTEWTAAKAIAAGDDFVADYVMGKI